MNSVKGLFATAAMLGLSFSAFAQTPAKTHVTETNAAHAKPVAAQVSSKTEVHKAKSVSAKKTTKPGQSKGASKTEAKLKKDTKI